MFKKEKTSSSFREKKMPLLKVFVAHHWRNVSLYLWNYGLILLELSAIQKPRLYFHNFCALYKFQVNTSKSYICSQFS